jgi:tRNA A-37 threonylcarbamoyl transferase component Bud32
MDVGHHKIVEPRAPTAPSGAERNKITGRLPDDLVSEQVRRLALFSAIGAGVWAFTLVMQTVVRPLAVGLRIPAIEVVILVAGVVTGLAVFLFVRYAPDGSPATTWIGLVFMMVNAILIAMLNTWTVAPTVEHLNDRLSWNTILILITAMIVPATPRKMLAAALVAASMDPLGVWIAHLRGVAVPSAVATIVLFMPNYICAVVSILPSHVLQHVGRRLREAQAMGSYHLVELLGRGGMGEVWRAEHQLLARSAAIKLIRPEILGASSTADSTTARRRFEREAQATASLSSQHTIRVFDFGVTNDGTFYYVMELLAGRDLDSLVREFGPVPAERAVYLLRQACHSLADAHARGLVHRDIKPANIYTCRMGLEYDFVKVLDFGLVKVNDQSSMQETLTSTHTTTGTPAFMAPEVILGQSDVDPRADVYAIGCVAYYLLTGELVFEADTTMKMLMHHVQTPPLPPSQRTELPIPLELDELVMACLQKDPNKRPQDAGVLFEMTCHCTTGGSTWNNAASKRWWETHLMELTGPLAVAVVQSESVTRGVAIL